MGLLAIVSVYEKKRDVNDLSNPNPAPKPTTNSKRS